MTKAEPVLFAPAFIQMAIAVFELPQRSLRSCPIFYRKQITIGCLVILRAVFRGRLRPALGAAHARSPLMTVQNMPGAAA